MKRLNSCRNTLLAAMLAVAAPLAFAQTGTTGSTMDNSRNMNSQRSNDAESRTDMGPSSGSAAKPVPSTRGNGATGNQGLPNDNGQIPRSRDRHLESRTDMGPSSGASGKPVPQR